MSATIEVTRDVASQVGVRKAVAKSGAVSLAGAIVSAALGFVFTVLLARELGEHGAGVVLQSVATFTIALGFARFGMDTTAVWLLPRLAEDSVSKIRGALIVGLASSAAAGFLGTGAIYLVASSITDSAAAAESVQRLAWFLPVAAAFTTAMSAMRGLGGVTGFALIGNVLVPTLRVGALLALTSVGTGYMIITVGWAAPFVPGVILAAVALIAQVRRHEARTRVRGPFRADRATASTMFRFALPRLFASTLEQGLTWIDVVLVGAIAGTSAAGVYGTASRFMAAGLVIDSALRVAVAPTFSRLLKSNTRSQLQLLYSDTSIWLVLLSTPVYLILGIYASTVLGWLGNGFTSGATALQFLCIGISLTLAAGNIHSVLLMSGRSGWAAFNKVVVLSLNVVGNLVLIPHFGINAAAAVWAATMVLDAVLAGAEVAFMIGVHIQLKGIIHAFGGVALTIGGPTITAHHLLGGGLTSLVVASAAALVLFASWCFTARQSLGLARMPRGRHS